MTTLAGTGKLIRLILRRERLRLGIWVVVLVIVPVFTATAFIDLYPDQASREALAATVASSPALTALLGPLYDSSIGGLTAWRAGTLGAFFVALMAILTMIRHTREEEETGRRELLGATVVGRHAPLVAALAVTIGAGLLVAGLLTAGLAGVGLPLAGSFAFGLGYAGVAVVFAGVGAVAAQLTEASSTRAGSASVSPASPFSSEWQATRVGRRRNGWRGSLRSDGSAVCGPSPARSGGSYCYGWAFPLSSSRQPRWSPPDGTWGPVPSHPGPGPPMRHGD